ncbi:MAG: PIN domain-containing protein [Dehalococcoidia bacterium]
MIIADSTVWIDFIRDPDTGHGALLRDLLRERRLALVGVVLAEVLRGLNPENTQEVQDLLDFVPFIEMTRTTWRLSGEIAQALDLKGQRLPMADIFIAARALEGDHEVFTRDKHFQRIPGLRLYQPEGDEGA